MLVTPLPPLDLFEELCPRVDLHLQETPPWGVNNSKALKVILYHMIMDWINNLGLIMTLSLLTF